MLLLLTLPALGLLADFPELHQASPQERESAYSILINNYLPSGFKGLTLAALAAAVMSTVSSHLSYGAQTIVNDVLQPIFKISDDKKVWAGRMVMVGMMLLSVLVVYLSDSLLGIAITLLGLFGSSAGDTGGTGGSISVPGWLPPSAGPAFTSSAKHCSAAGSSGRNRRRSASLMPR